MRVSLTEMLVSGVFKSCWGNKNMNLKGLTNTKLVVILRKKKHLRNMICADSINYIGSAIYNLAMLTLASKQTYSTLAISLANLLGGIPGWINPVLAYMTDRETKRLKKATILNIIQILIYIILAFVMLKYKMPLALFVLVILANVVSDSLDNYINNMFIPFTKTWVAPDERRLVTSFEIVLLGLCVVVGQLLGASWLVWFPNDFFGLSLFNAVTFAVSLYFIKKVKFDDKIKTIMPKEQHFSIKDFLDKMKTAYNCLRGCHVLQIMWVLTCFKFAYASYSLILTVAMVSEANLRFGNFAQTLVVLQVIMTLGFFIGSFLRFNWLEKSSYEQLMMSLFFALGIAALNCLFGGPLVVVLAIMLFVTIISGYASPKYTADLVQKIGEEHLARVESLLGFIGMLGNSLGSLLATIILQLFSLATAWVLLLFLMVGFTVLSGVLIYQTKHH